MLRVIKNSQKCLNKVRPCHFGCEFFPSVCHEVEEQPKTEDECRKFKDSPQSVQFHNTFYHFEISWIFNTTHHLLLDLKRYLKLRIEL